MKLPPTVGGGDGHYGEENQQNAVSGRGGITLATVEGCLAVFKIPTSFSINKYQVFCFFWVSAGQIFEQFSFSEGELSGYISVDKLFERNNQFYPMKWKKYWDEETKLCILKDAVMGTDWGLRVATQVTDKPSFHRMINALNYSQWYMYLHLAEKEK